MLKLRIYVNAFLTHYPLEVRSGGMKVGLSLINFSRLEKKNIIVVSGKFAKKTKNL